MTFRTPGVCEPMIDLKIDNYRLLEVVGQGGMGCVYRARDEKMGRIVALKLLRDNLGAFTLREGKALGQLNHPNIVNVFYMGEAPEGVFMVMEFVDGGTLHDYMDREVSQVIAVMKQSLLALEHAHGAGVIHRDIKPSNIMVSKAGQVKVMDFGLAKVESPDSDRTVTRLQAGTISYMSPEQVRGLQHVSQLSDIYSLGKSFYHILAQRLPFNASESDQYSILKAIIERQFKPPGYYNKRVPRGLDKIIMKAIEKEPSNRYQSARAMYQALESFEARTYRKPVLPATSPTNALLPGFSLTKKQWVAGALMALGFLCVIAFASWYTSRDTQTSLAEQTRTSISFEESGTSLGSATNTPSTELEENTSPSQSQIFLSVSASPANSVIRIGDSEIQGPINQLPINSGEHKLIVESEGYDVYSEVVTLTKDTSLTIQLAEQGHLIVESRTPGAMVSIDGKSFGQAPVNLPMAQGSYRVVVTADGYSTFRRRVNVRSGNNARVTATLQKEAILQIQTTSGSAIFVDGREQRQVGSTQPLSMVWPPGTYQLRITHSQYGIWEKKVTLQEGMNSVNVDFTKQVQVNIGTNVFGASIYVDGVQTEKETPTQLSVGIGLRRIEVRKDGYSVDPPYIEQLLEDSEDDPFRVAFTLTKNE